MIDGRQVARDYPAQISIGTIYRVIHGAREIEPLHRQTGGPIEIYSITEETALLIAKQVLQEVTGADIARLDACGGSAVLPLPDET